MKLKNINNIFKINDMKKKQNYSILIYYFMLIQGFIFLQNSIIWSFTDDISDKWFLRACISIVCFGFAGIISAINNTIKNDYK